MTYLQENDRREISAIFSEISNNINLKLFVNSNCPACSDTHRILEELSALSEKISVSVKNVDEEPVLGIEMTPAIELAENLRFYGLPEMNEFQSLIEGILLVSSGKSGVDDYIVDDIKGAAGKIRLFVTPYCPVCPDATEILMSFAVENKNIHVDIYSIETFPELKDTYKIRGTPTIITDKSRIDYDVPDEIMLLNMLTEEE